MSAVKWHAIVTDRDDPERRFRVKASVPDFLQDRFGGAQETSWALPSHCGVEYVPPLGAGVWIEWAARNEVAHEFIWSGEYSSMPGGLSENTNVVQERLRGNSPYGRGSLEVTTEDLSTVGGPEPATFMEPESFQATEYPKNKVIKSPEGNVVMELDDTAGGRVHETTGQYYREVNADGISAQRCSVRMDFVMEREQRLVNGPLTEVVSGDVHRQVGGDCNTYVHGASHILTGPVKAKLSSVTIDIDQDASGLEVTALGQMLLQAIAGFSVAASTVDIKAGTTANVAAGGMASLQAGPLPATQMAVQVTPAGVSVGPPVPATGVVLALLSPLVGTPLMGEAFVTWVAGVQAAVATANAAAGLTLAPLTTALTAGLPTSSTSLRVTV